MEFHANDEDSEVIEEDEMNYFNVDEILNAGADCDGFAVLIQLPRHVCHRLNLVAATNVEKAMPAPGSAYDRLSHASFGIL